MQFICPICTAAVDELGFRIPAPEISEVTAEKACVECRMESMRRRAVRCDKSIARKRPVETLPAESPSYRAPYKD